MTRALALLLALSVVTVATPVHAAVPTVTVELDVSALPVTDVTGRLEAHLLEEQTRILTDTGLELADDAEATIHITVSRYGDADINYRATIALLREGIEAPEVERTITCELCRDGEFVIKVGDEVAVLSERVLYAPKDEPEEADTATEGPIEPTEDEPPTTTEKPKRIGPMGGAGIASMAAGVGAMAAGIPLALANDKTRSIASGVERRTTRPTGIALASVGGALLVTGAALVAVDVLRRHKQRRVSFLPTIRPSMLTVSMGMRF